MSAPLTDWQADILGHAARNGRYVTGDPAVLALAALGLLCDYGLQTLAAGDHYLRITGPGVAALREWRERQPAPPKLKRRSEAFTAWMGSQDSYRVPFSYFLKNIWPTWRTQTWRAAQ